MGSAKEAPRRVIAVTGAARGIGLAIAERLSATGNRIAIGDLDAAAAVAVAARLPGEAAGFPLDVTDSASFRSFLDAVEAQWGPIDVLVNNAGVMWVGSFDEEPEQATHRQLEVNLHGVIRGVRLTAPRMRARGRGHVVTVASAAAKLAPPGEATYAATKHGVYGYLSAVRAELRGSGVELSVVMPTVVDTALAAGTSSGAVAMLTPDDIAKTVAAVIARPRFEVTVPRYVNPLVRVVGLLPDALRAALYRRMVPDQVAALSENRSARAQYERTAVTAEDRPGER
ncbi:SDR family oxidoreductase [Nocardia miyunensis]|uniref:SDR family oxidoreductase n=1 Tax=Nocardia miyunensis TaxID=282684 RepID=UPI00082F8C8E|nr:SDR family oxidoreductase [Nocardia miyunensis]